MHTPNGGFSRRSLCASMGAWRGRGAAGERLLFSCAAKPRGCREPQHEGAGVLWRCRGRMGRDFRASDALRATSAKGVENGGPVRTRRGDGPASEPGVMPWGSDSSHGQYGLSFRYQAPERSRSTGPGAGTERPGGLGGGSRSAAGPIDMFLSPNGRGSNRRRAGTPKDPGPKSFSGPRYARGGLRTVRRSVLPSSFTTSSVVSRVQRRFNRLERLTSTSVFDVVSRLRS